MHETLGRRLNRRLFLRWSLVAGSASLAAACAPAPAASPTAAPAKPTEAAKPAAPAPAPAAPAAPAASPAAAPKPAAAASPAEAAKPAAQASPAAAEKPAAGAGRWGMTAQEEAAWKQIEETAKKEGALTYYAVGSIPQNKVEMLQNLWAKDYPEIKINYLFIGNNSQVMGRVTSEQESKNYVADVAEMAQFNQKQAPQDFFEAFVPPSAKDSATKWVFAPGETPARNNGRYVIQMAQYYAIWINTNLVTPADAPKTAMDLASNPKWKGQIMTRAFWSTGGGNHLYHFAKQVYGMDWITKMQAQNPTFADDQDAALLQVARGEFAVGLGLTGRTASQLIKDGQPISSIWPDDFVITVTNGTPLLAHAPHPNAAKVFINWMLTEPGQRLWRDLGQFPVRAEVPPADPWMQGFNRAKQTFENLMTEEEQKASLAEAAGYFKK